MVVPRHGKWSTCSVMFVGVERAPLGPVVDLLIVDNEATVFAHGFGGVGDNPSIAFGTLFVVESNCTSSSKVVS